MDSPVSAPSRPERADVVIVGAGFAGLATAAALAERGARRVVVVEAEAVFGQHSSGRNAAIARRLIEDAALTRLAADSVAMIDALAERAGIPLIRHVGGLLLGDRAAIDGLLAAAGAAPALAAEVRELAPAEAVARVPALAGARFERALLTPGCGVVDIHALLGAFAADVRRGGGEVRFRSRVEGVDVTGGRVAGVRTTGGAIACDVVVDAAGFAANAIAGLAGLAPLPFDPVRRHLFVTAPWGGIDRDAPFVWDVTAGYYFRPESAGLLMCSCDATSWPPEDPPTDPTAREALAAKFHAEVPALREVSPTRGWAGLRVLTPDGRFVVGADPRLEGFFWVAGLGGHGVTTSAGVGALAADAIGGGAVSPPFDVAFAPGRLLDGARPAG